MTISISQVLVKIGVLSLTLEDKTKAQRRLSKGMKESNDDTENINTK